MPWFFSVQWDWVLVLSGRLSWCAVWRYQHYVFEQIDPRAPHSGQQSPRLHFRNENELCPALLTVKKRDSGGLDFSKIWEFAFESDSVFQIVGVSVW